MITRFRSGWIAAALLIAQSRAAEAHIVASRLGDFYAGALHPLTDLQDVVLWIAIGVLAGSLGVAKGRWLVLVFPLGLLAGTLLANVLSPAATGTTADASMILILGLLLAAAIRIPAAPLYALAFVLAVMRGAANAGDLGPEINRVLFTAGLVCAGYVVITLVMALTVAFQGPAAETATNWRKIAVRAFGGWIAAIGLMMVSFAFAS